MKLSELIDRIEYQESKRGNSYYHHFSSRHFINDDGKLDSYVQIYCWCEEDEAYEPYGRDYFSEDKNSHFDCHSIKVTISNNKINTLHFIMLNEWKWLYKMWAENEPIEIDVVNWLCIAKKTKYSIEPKDYYYGKTPNEVEKELKISGGKRKCD